MLRSFASIAVTLLAVAPIFGDQISLTPSKDNTLYEDLSGSTSNGAGEVLFAGATAGSSKRRALMAFDLSSIPSGATINSATLTMSVSRGGPSATDLFSLYRANSSWGEGTSSSTQGSGAPSTTNDATWIHRFYNTTLWANPGGDFSATSSASVSIGPTNFYALSTASLAADVQGWLTSPATNFGWLFKGTETVAGSAIKIASREAFTAADRPTLTINYTAGSSSSNWLGDTDGGWADATKWSAGVPDAAGAHAVLGPVISTGRTITLSSARSVGTLSIDSAQPYTVSGSGTLNFDASSSDVFLNVNQGSHAIQTSVSVAAGKTLHKTGTGSIQVKPLSIDSLSVDDGTLAFDGSGATASLKTLSLAGGKLDVKSSTLQLDDGATSPTNAVRSALAAGSLLSTAASLPQKALAYRGISATRVDVSVALAGDANFDGKVNTADFNVLAGNFGAGGKYWVDADFNYDATVSSIDFGILSANYGNTLSASATALGTSVPEPAGMVTLAALLAAKRRKRR